MKLSSSRITSFLDNPDPKVRAVLLYGPDAGLVRERADRLARKTVSDLNDPFRVAVLAGGAANNPARLHDEAAAMALGGGRRLVRIPDATDGLASALGAFLDAPPPGDGLILIEAGDLEKRSKLRTLCESETPLAAAVPCYAEDGAQKQRTISIIMEASGIRVSRDALALLASTLPPDRLATRSELDKLALYAHGKQAVSIEDVRACLGDGGAAETDDLVHAVAEGDAKRAAVLLDHLFAEQVSIVAVLRAAQRHFLRLQLARASIDGGLSAKAAVEKLQPKVFWKHVEPMARQAQRWSAPVIEKFLQRLFETEAAVKKTGTPDAALCAQVLLGAAHKR